MLPYRQPLKCVFASSDISILLHLQRWTAATMFLKVNLAVIRGLFKDDFNTSE
jgi:hypothetical protein